MCGRYYVDAGMKGFLQDLTGMKDEEWEIQPGDVHPSEVAVVLTRAAGRFSEKSDCLAGASGRLSGSQNCFSEVVRRPSGLPDGLSGTSACSSGLSSVFKAEPMAWGFPKHEGSGLIINARAETLLDKPFFRESALHRRCVIPASGFYEWNRWKEKVTFRRGDSPVLYMAGIYREFHFVIVTTQANESMAPVHDRMPLILDEEEAAAWLCDDASLSRILKKVPPLLEKSQEQLRLPLDG